jgi:Cdc6-like AAA superfamily ATPase
VDPLPQEQVFRTVLKPNTTFLIGRKGTGKSTIFQRLQYELAKSKTATSAYIDIKTVFESSQVDPQLAEQLRAAGNVLPQASLERLLLYKAFLREVIVELKKELRKRTEATLWERVKAKFGGSLDELFEDLDGLLVDADGERFVSVVGIVNVGVQRQASSATKTEETATLAANSVRSQRLVLRSVNYANRKPHLVRTFSTPTYS